jgi:hypothetical protein
VRAKKRMVSPKYKRSFIGDSISILVYAVVGQKEDKKTELDIKKA